MLYHASMCKCRLICCKCTGCCTKLDLEFIFIDVNAAQPNLKELDPPTEKSILSLQLSGQSLNH